LCWRDLNFGTRASLTRFAVVAILLSLFYLKPYKIDVFTRPGGTACRRP
jgi:hypothetical protein